MSLRTYLSKLRFDPSRRGWILLVVAGALVSSFAADAVASIGSVRPGVEVAGLDLGGQSREEAERLLTRRAERLATDPVELFTEGHRVAVEPDDVGFFPDVDATLERAMAVGRHGNLFIRSWHRLRSYFASTQLGWVSSIDRESADALIGTWAERFDDEGYEAGIRVSGARIVAVDPRPGRRLDRRRARLTIQRGFETYPRRSLELPFAVRGRDTDASDAARAAEFANRLLRGPVTLMSPDDEPVELQPAELAPLLEAVPVERRGEWILEVRFSAEQVREQLGPRMEPFEREPRNASFSVGGGSVSVDPGRDGLSFDAEQTAAALLQVARRDPPRRTQAAFSSVEPSLTTEGAQALRINERVSTFTTNYPCCPPRVKNIQRIAQIVDGALIRPGETFSLNRFVGRRTAERGFVSAPMIYDGEYKDDIGGGVSQFATTFYNAIFFGGYKLDTYRAHSYYISRYPPGREATISWPSPDLKFTNDSPGGILVKTSASNTSVTVSFYGDKQGKTIQAEAGERTNFTDPPEQRKPNPDLPPAQERVVQSGSRGFDIVVWRVITTADGKTNRQRFFTRYKPEPRIIEFGPGTPEPTPEPTPEEPPPTPAPTPAPTPPPDPDE